MYKTVTECSARLNEIDSVLVKLERDKAIFLLEQGYVSNLMNLLKETPDESEALDETPPEMRSRYLLLDVIREKPGLSTRELKKNVDGTIPPEKFDGYLSLLQQKKSIENRGERKPHGARWYAKV